MTNDELRVMLAKALEEMKKKAVDMGIKGEAAASVLNRGENKDIC